MKRQYVVIVSKRGQNPPIHEILGPYQSQATATAIANRFKTGVRTAHTRMLHSLAYYRSVWGNEAN